MKRRSLIRHAALATAGLYIAVSAASALAQQRPVRLLVGFPAGGSTDVVARVLAEGMSHLLQRTVIVENRPGAGGQIAANLLKQSPPDGNTLFLSNSHALSMIPLTVRNPGYETLKDFASVGLVAISPDVLSVNPAVVGPVSDLRGLANWARAHPDRASIGVPAASSDPEFGVRLLASTFKVDLNPVPYRGDGPVAQDLIAGQIPGGIGSIGAMLPHARTGRLRIIAVSGPKRIASLPNVPTYVEQGVEGYGTSGFVAVLAPVGTPSETIMRYNTAITQVVNSPRFAEKLSELAIVPTSSTPEELTARIRDAHNSFAAIVRRTGFQIP
ncbi:tripartite tricarboxylate transporter substrate-binding protein [Cupriavidus pinatubonensis]|uniref:tripartite tricarboxylate transporter substrate-binding protein n=1 Tax=Cupriavidus pinatubonensis TaxID=248026 RepID=UPI00361CBBBB